MAFTPSIILHGGPIVEITLLDYLYHVVLYLFAFGGVALVVFWGLGAVSAVYAGVVERRGGGENDS